MLKGIKKKKPIIIKHHGIESNVIIKHIQAICLLFVNLYSPQVGHFFFMAYILYYQPQIAVNK